MWARAVWQENLIIVRMRSSFCKDSHHGSSLLTDLMEQSGEKGNVGKTCVLSQPGRHMSYLGSPQKRECTDLGCDHLNLYQSSTFKAVKVIDHASDSCLFNSK